MYPKRFRVWAVGFRDWGLGGLGFGELRVWGLGGLGFRVWCVGSRI